MSVSSWHPAPRDLRVAVAIVPLAIRDGALSVLLGVTEPQGSRPPWSLVWDGPQAGESPDTAAERLALWTIRGAHSPAQHHAIVGTDQRRKEDPQLVAGYFVLVPTGDGRSLSHEQWHRVDRLPELSAPHRVLVDGAVRRLREQLPQRPVAFELLPPSFTLAELQEVYEILLGRPLHKASFRRALHAAELVANTEQIHAEGRGRPARLFRFSPPAPGRPLPLRFDLGGL